MVVAVTVVFLYVFCSKIVYNDGVTKNLPSRLRRFKVLDV